VMILGEISVGERADFNVDQVRRASIMRNHSATHLLNAALRQHLGAHVNQKGSLVEERRLRFDFSHPTPLTEADIQSLEGLINFHILENQAVETEVMSMDDAVAKGAIALFGEKYGDEVRVLSMGLQQTKEEGHFSIELCGGTHVHSTGDIGLFKITSETGVASGVRRIEAVTGLAAFDFVKQLQSEQKRLANLLKTDPTRLFERTEQLVSEIKLSEQALAQAQQKLALYRAIELLEDVEVIAGHKVLIKYVEDLSSQHLKGLVEQLKLKMQEGIILLVIAHGDKVQLCAGVTDGLKFKVKAGDLVKTAALCVGGKGGGRSDFAMAGGKDSSRVHEAVVVAREWVEKSLS